MTTCLHTREYLYVVRVQLYLNYCCNIISSTGSRRHSSVCLLRVRATGAAPPTTWPEGQVPHRQGTRCNERTPASPPVSGPALQTLDATPALMCQSQRFMVRGNKRNPQPQKCSILNCLPGSPRPYHAKPGLRGSPCRLQ